MQCSTWLWIPLGLASWQLQQIRLVSWYPIRTRSYPLGTLFVRLASGNNEQVLVPITTTTTIAVALPSQLSRMKAGRPGIFLPGNGPAFLAAAAPNLKY